MDPVIGMNITLLGEITIEILFGPEPVGEFFDHVALGAL